MKKIDYTKEEFIEFTNELNKLLNSFKKEEVYNEFLNGPISFLRKQNYPTLYNTVKKNHSINRSFGSNIFNHFKRYNLFDQCAKCKLTILFCIYFILGKLSLGAEGVVQAIEFILDFIKKFYGENHQLPKDLDLLLGDILGRLSPFTLARRLCITMNKC